MLPSCTPPQPPTLINNKTWYPKIPYLSLVSRSTESHGDAQADHMGPQSTKLPNRAFIETPCINRTNDLTDYRVEDMAENRTEDSSEDRTEDRTGQRLRQRTGQKTGHKTGQDRGQGRTRGPLNH